MHPVHSSERNEQVRGVVTTILAARQRMKKDLIWGHKQQMENLIKNLPKINL
ncbi:MAG: hypothetical protein RLZZ283_374 [Candidatus Parcubacteria bacterium]|jgi:hypothetical protein